MAPRKSKISCGKKRKIKSKKPRFTKRKSVKRKCKRTVPLKKRQINRSDFNDSEIKKFISNDVYNQIFENKAKSLTDFPLEELYYDDRTFSSSEASEEERCESFEPDHFHELPEALKRKKPTSSNESIVQKYIDSGMNHVASFIVESAIRFGQEQGIVIPEKENKNLYHFVSPYAEDKDKKIRFRIPSKIFGYEDAKKAMWKRRKQRKPLHLAKSIKIKTEDLPSESGSEKRRKRKVKRRRKKAEITETISSSSIVI